MRLLHVSLWALLIDQISKISVIHFLRLDQSVALIPHFVYLTYIQNKGAAFGFMADMNALVRIPFFIMITVGAGLVIYAYQRFIPAEKAFSRFALGLIWGGAMGNFIDRVFHGKVVDFIDVGHLHVGKFYFPWVFNLADSYITVGLSILVLVYWFGKKESVFERF